MSLYWGKKRSAEEENETGPELIYNELYKEIPNETLTTALLSIHLLFRNRVEGNNAVTSNEKPGWEEDVLWEFHRSHLQSHPAYQSDPHSDFIRYFRVGVFEHAPTVFESVRLINDQTATSLCESFDPTLNASTIESHSGNKGGRSSAFMYFTNDKRFILKTLTAKELRFMQKHSQDFLHYYESSEGSSSFLAKIFGLFTVHIRDKFRIRVAVLENIFHSVSAIRSVFDLKGSRIHRASLPDGLTPTSILSFPQGPIYKDLDFLRIRETPRVKDWDRVVMQLERDSVLLRSIGAIDYSLLIGVSPDTHSSDTRRTVIGEHFILVLGVIDYLQAYNLRKRAEKYIKRVLSPRVDPLHISVTDPVTYQSRLISFIAPLFEGVNEGCLSVSE